jgi:hypothetical protein
MVGKRLGKLAQSLLLAKFTFLTVIAAQHSVNRKLSYCRGIFLLTQCK